MNDSDEDRTKFGWIVQGMATSTSAIRAATRTGEDGRAQGMKRKKMREEKEGEYQPLTADEMEGQISWAEESVAAQPLYSVHKYRLQCLVSLAPAPQP